MSSLLKALKGKTGIQIGIGISICGGVYYYMHNKSMKAKTHPTREISEAALKLDNRISNYCGRNYRTTKYEWLGEDDKIVKYRIKIEGIRGKCKVLVKCEKHSHLELVNHSLEQEEYAKLSREEKSKSTFNPYNFNDVLIPTKETLEKMKSLLGANQLELDNNGSSLLEYNHNKYINGDYKNLLINSNLQDNDTFYRLSSIVMVANDSLVFNIRPISPKFREYDVEDTIYHYKTYGDAIAKVLEYKDKLYSITNYNQSSEEFRNEIILQKQTKYQDMMYKRKNLTLFEGVIFIMGMITYKMVTKNTIDVTTLKALQNKITSLNKKYMGAHKKLLCISYKYTFIKKRFEINGLVLGEGGKMAKISTYAQDGSGQAHSEVYLELNNQTKEIYKI